MMSMLKPTKGFLRCLKAYLWDFHCCPLLSALRRPHLPSSSSGSEGRTAQTKSRTFGVTLAPRSDNNPNGCHFSCEPALSGCTGNGRRNHKVPEEQFLGTEALLGLFLHDLLPSLQPIPLAQGSPLKPPQLIVNTGVSPAACMLVPGAHRK